MTNKRLFNFSNLQKLISVLIALILIVNLISCAVNPVTGKHQFMLLTERDELQLGEDNLAAALWGAEGGGGPYIDEKLRRYLESIVLDIHRNSHRPHLPIKFYIQNTSAPNAWALPGHVAITRGLLAELHNEAEFAFVMGHEIGHVSARHTASHYSNYLLMQGVLAALGLAFEKKDYVDLILGLGLIGGTLILLKYSRDDELEADRLGVIYMKKLGYDPNYAIKVHEILEQAFVNYKKSIGEKVEDDSFFGDILSTHPRTRVRIDELKKLIDATSSFSNRYRNPNKEYFLYMTSDLRRINALYRDYYDKALIAFKNKNLYEAERLMNEAIWKERTQPAFYALYAFIQLKKEDYSVAEKYFNYALTIDRNYQPAIRGLGIISYKRKDYYNSIAQLKKAIKLFPEDFNSLFYLGMSYYKLSDYQEAIPYLEKFSEAKPNHSSINGYLGICYENTGDIRKAYEAYLRQIDVNKTNQMGRHAANRITILKSIIEEEERKEQQKQKKKKK